MTLSARDISEGARSWYLRCLAIGVIVSILRAPLVAFADDTSSPLIRTQHIARCSEADDAVDRFNEFIDYRENRAHAYNAAFELNNVANRLIECARRELHQTQYAAESNMQEAALTLNLAVAYKYTAIAIADFGKECSLRQILIKGFNSTADLLPSFNLTDDEARQLGKTRDLEQDIEMTPCP